MRIRKNYGPLAMPRISASRFALDSLTAKFPKKTLARKFPQLSTIVLVLTLASAPQRGLGQGIDASMPTRPASASTPSARAAADQRELVQGIFLNMSQFEIPFTVETVGAEPREVQLFVSRDAGQRWELTGRQPAGQRRFVFSAPTDGDYWFATRTIDVNGQPHPGGQVAPQLRVTVDTVKPELSARVDADGNGQIILDFRISDDAPLADSLRVEYMTDAVRQWIPVTSASKPSFRESGEVIEGRMVWVPESQWRHVYVRVMVRDRAGNQSVVTKQVEKPRVAKQETPAQLASAPRGSGAIAGQIAAGPPAYHTSSPGEGKHPLWGEASGPVSASPPGYAKVADSTLPLRGNQTGNGLQLNAPTVSAPHAETESSERFPPETVQHDSSQPEEVRQRQRPEDALRPLGNVNFARPNGQTETSLPEMLPPPAAVRDDYYPTSTEDSDRELEMQPDRLQEPEFPPQDRSEAMPDYRVQSPAGVNRSGPVQQSPRRNITLNQIPPGAIVRQSGSRSFSLDYELESIGRSGIDSIELWATKDFGRTWDFWDTDPDGESPFDIITAGDGVYGFRIVVVGRNGLTSPRPLDGEDADIYVMVDTSKPVVRITGARYGEQDDTGKLLIYYSASDSHDNLARRPITLKFSESPSGPWTTIATGLDNDGFYAWPADPELPPRIYLRAEAIDRAGNIGSDTLEQPIAVEGLRPRARIRGFQPVQESPPAARFQ